MVDEDKDKNCAMRPLIDVDKFCLPKPDLDSLAPFDNVDFS